MRYPDSFIKLEAPRPLFRSRVADLTQNIVASLHHLLSARAGQSPAAPSFGVIGGAHGLRALLCEMPRTRPDIAALIQHAVTEGEPRLFDVTVTSQPDADVPDEHIIFTLSARLRESLQPWQVDLVLKPSGHMVLAAPRPSEF